ncbi:MAG TPA: response regulator [Flavisolibacter sp.]|nr:response regulator [Flavisolibacter sp.]
MPTILYVDDDIDDLNFLREAFTEIDPAIHVAEVNNGVEALHHLESLKPNPAFFPSLIIMDINMPLMDGRMTIKKIKEDSTLQQIPIVAFTTSNNPMDRLVCGQMGVKCVLKPNSALELKQIAKEFLQTYVYSQ